MLKIEMKPARTLLIAAFLIALLWRLEVELRGWDGLTWLGYFHISIPLGGLLFLGWIRFVTRSDERSTKIVGFVTIWGLIVSFVLDYAASVYFVGGAAAMGYVMTLGALFDYVHWLSPMVWGASILALYAGYRCFFRFSPAVWIIGFVLWLASWHLGLIVVSILPERGYHDLIHALKTGWLIPFCVIAVGLPIVSLTHDTKRTGAARP